MISHNKICIVMLLMFLLCSVIDAFGSLVAEYRLDECSFASGVSDSIGNNHNGSAIGDTDTIQNDGAGGICRSALFDGVGDYITVPDSTALVTAGAFTASVWFKADATENYDGIITKLNSVGGQGGSGRGWNININHGTIMSLLSDSSGNYQYLSSWIGVHIGDWYHVVLVHKVDNTNILYVNGVNCGELSHGVAQSDNGNLFQIGKFYSNSNGLLFNGVIDEVELFDTALDTNAVHNVYVNELAGKNYDGSNRSCQNCAMVPTPHLDYRFDDCAWDGSAGEVVDISNNGYDGQAVGGVVTDDLEKRICRSAVFDGVDDYISVPSNGLGQLLTTASLSFWIKTTQTGSNTAWQAPGVTGVEQSGGVDDIFWGFIDANGHIGIAVGNNNDAKSTTVINDNNFHHVVLTRDSPTGELQVYVDGVLEKTATETTGNIGNGFSSIGRVENTDSTKTLKCLAAKLDEVKVFDRVLSADEAEVLYRNEYRGVNYDGVVRSCNSCTPLPDPIAYYRLDECYWDGSPSEVIDSSNNGNNGTSSGDAATVDNDGNGGVCRYGLFDGDGDKLEVADAAVLKPAGAFSASVWFRANSLGRWNGIVSKLTNVNSHTGRGWNINVQSGNKISSLMADSNGAFKYIVGTTAVQPNTWYHVVLVHQADNDNYLYVNGRLEAHNRQAVAFTNNPLQIGTFYTNGSSLYFDGNIDDMILFDEAIDQFQVADMYQNYRDGKDYAGNDLACSSCAVGEWRFDECELNTAVADYGGNNFTGNIVNTVSSTAGKLCRGGSFEGTDSYVRIDDEDKFDDTSQLTISMWFNAEQIHQDNGTNARGLISKRLSAGNNESFGVFFWNGNGNKLWIDIDGTNNRFSSTTDFAERQWYHIDIVYDGGLPQNERVKLYVNGVLDSTHAETSTRIPGYNSDLFIGNLYYGSSQLKVFKGSIDEVRLTSHALTAAEISEIYNNESAGYDYRGFERICLCGPDHFKIDHDSTAINCMPEEITVSAHDAIHDVLDTYNGTIELSTSTGHGNWLIGSGKGVLQNGAANDGVASYTFDEDDHGVVKVLLSDTFAEVVNIDVADGDITEHSGAAAADEDPDLEFKNSGFFFHIDNDVNNNITTQICGKSSAIGYGMHTLHLVALRSDKATNSCATALEGSVPVEIGFECVEPTTGTKKIDFIASGTASSVSVSATPGGGARNYKLIVLDFDADGAELSINYHDVGKVKLFARYVKSLEVDADGNRVPNTGVDLSGDSNEFVVRPFGVYLTLADNPAANDASGGVFKKAGEQFSMTATAVCWQNSDDSDNDGLPDGHSDNNPTNNVDLSDNQLAVNANGAVTVSHKLWQPTAGEDGALGGTTSVAMENGAVATTDLTFSEVGIIELHASLEDYLGSGIDTVGCSGAVGRFIPDHFKLDQGFLTTRVDRGCMSTSDFTYLGENLTFTYDLTAMNADPSGVKTKNYKGDFAKFGGIGAQKASNGGTYTVGAIDDPLSGSLTQLSSRINVDSSLMDNAWDDSRATFSLKLSVARNVTPDGPFGDVAFGVYAEDSDGVKIADFDLDTDEDGTPDHKQAVATTKLKYGRINIENAHGSELLNLPMVMQTEYWQESVFITNNDDNCTDVGEATLTLDGASETGVTGDNPIKVKGNKTTTATITNQPLSSGDAGLVFSAPGTGGDGWVDVELTVPDYLQFDWHGTGDDNPRARATFGIYRGNEHIIYLRETTWRH